MAGRTGSEQDVEGHGASFNVNETVVEDEPEAERDVEGGEAR
jgi:hypothetical protein